MTTSGECVRLATADDAAGCLAVYAPFVRDTIVSFEEEVPSVEEMRARIESTLERAPWIVLEADGRIEGFAYAGPYRPRAAYAWTAESAIYLAPHVHGRGLGRRLYSTLIALLKLQGYRRLVGVIALPNPASVALHERVGFRAVGVLHGVGFKYGRFHDTGWWELELSSEPPNARPIPPRELAVDEAWRAVLRAGA